MDRESIRTLQYSCYSPSQLTLTCCWPVNETDCQDYQMGGFDAYVRMWNSPGSCESCVSWFSWSSGLSWPMRTFEWWQLLHVCIAESGILLTWTVSCTMNAFSTDMNRLALSKLFDSRGGFWSALEPHLRLRQGCRTLMQTLYSADCLPSTLYTPYPQRSTDYWTIHSATL